MNYTNSLVESLKYKHGERVKKDLNLLQNAFHDLRPSVGTYYFKNFYGNKRDLINFNGTIPITFKGKTYNIPIRIWIPENYPSSPPDCFVTPTPNMVIRPSKYIDVDGKIFLPYFKDWKATSDLVGAVQVMRSVFGEQCPVYTKSINSSSVIQHSASNTQINSYPSNFQIPKNTPLPGSHGSGINISSNRSPTNLIPKPPVPPPPNYGFVYDPSSVNKNLNYPSTPGQPSLPPYPTTQSLYPNHPPPINPASPLGSNLDPDVIKLSLASMLRDKIRNLLQDTFERAQIEMNNLLKTEQRLKDGSIVIQNILTVLDKENESASQKLQGLDRAIKSAEKDVEKFCKPNEPASESTENVQNASLAIDPYAYLDETVDGTTPLYKQMLSAYAEENALVDTLFYLGEALKRETIGLDDFLKNVRDLSRRQFLLKALMKKCRKSAGLPSY